MNGNLAAAKKKKRAQFLLHLEMTVTKLRYRPPPSPVVNPYYTGWAKSQYPYVHLYSSVTECPNEIILSGMTYYHHWFKEFVKSKHICVHFFQMKVHFRIYLIVWIVGSSQILLNCVWRHLNYVCPEKN